ncbi:MAG TPA: hypothetical protein VNZ93_24490 [Pseudorhodoplanes sp.]|nr:hypothetical protein [Pseudorhodoplanes sp.]
MDSVAYLILWQAPTTLVLTGAEAEDETGMFFAVLAKGRVA